MLPVINCKIENKTLRKTFDMVQEILSLLYLHVSILGLNQLYFASYC